MRLTACLIVKSGTFLGLQAFKLFYRSRMVSTDAAIFKSFLSSVACLDGSVDRTDRRVMATLQARVLEPLF